MRKTGTGQNQILRRIERAFAKNRQRNRGRASYSGPLRAMAVSALEVGLAPGKVAQASGVSQQSLTNWRSLLSSVKRPRQLQVVDSSAVRSLEGEGPSDSVSALIRLRSGVSIEMPMSGLTPALLVVLNGGAR